MSKMRHVLYIILLLLAWGAAVRSAYLARYYRREWTKALDSYCRVVDMAWELQMRHDALLFREAVRLGHDPNYLAIGPGDTVTAEATYVGE